MDMTKWGILSGHEYKQAVYPMVNPRWWQMALGIANLLTLTMQEPESLANTLMRQYVSLL